MLLLSYIKEENGMAFICESCGEIFKQEHWEDGYINHTNFTNNFNGLAKRDTKEDYYKYFLDVINLYGNLCNTRRVSKSASIKIYKCALKIAISKGNTELYNMFKSFSVNKAFNDLNTEIIKEYEREIEGIKDSIKYRKENYYTKE
jgi:hypothetical protein